MKRTILLQQAGLVTDCELPAPKFEHGEILSTLVRESNRPPTTVRKILRTASGRRFELRRVLQKANCGVVREASELVTDENSDKSSVGGACRRFAVKIMRPSSAVGNHECAALQLLQQDSPQLHCGESQQGHPGVLQPEALLRDDASNLYVVSPLCEGGELTSHVMSRGRLSEDEARPLFRRVLEALRFVHTRGICHHDVSPENILLDANRTEASIIDFGLCVGMPFSVDGRTRLLNPPDHRRGKPAYAAPEVHRGGVPYDGVACDVFSCGAVLFVMLTGQLPWAQATFHDRHFDAIVGRRQLAAVLRRRGIEIGSEAVALMQQMLSLDPAARPSVEEALQDEWTAGAV